MKRPYHTKVGGEHADSKHGADYDDSDKDSREDRLGCKVAPSLALGSKASLGWSNL